MTDLPNMKELFTPFVNCPFFILIGLIGGSTLGMIGIGSTANMISKIKFRKHGIAMLKLLTKK